MGLEPPSLKGRIRIFQMNLACDFRAECGGLGARFQFTNGLLIPTRETPTGSGQRALAFGGDGSVDDREDGGSTMRGRLAATVLVYTAWARGS
jgi:hypothetical protein